MAWNRAANEDASPIATKKQKATKGKPIESPAPKKEKKKAVEEARQEEEEEAVVVPKKTAAKEKPAKKAAKSKKEVVPEPEEPKQEEEAAEEAEEAEEEVDAATEALLETLDAGDEDDREDEPVSTFKKGQDVGKAPKPKKAAKASNGVKPSGNTGVMYLGSIPHGFYEHEIKEYFSQFGEITRLRVVRNKKTGASKHRAFLEFADAEVADIAARTMDSYLLFGHILRARVVDPSQVHAELFKGSNRRFKAVPWNAMVGRHLERPLGETKWQGKITKEEKRRAERAEKLKALGYEFESPALKAPKVQEVIEGATEEPVKVVEAPPAEVEEEKAEEAEKEEPTSISQLKTKKGKKGAKAKKVKA
jgi:nucleolar protein 15